MTRECGVPHPAATCPTREMVGKSEEKGVGTVGEVVWARAVACLSRRAQIGREEAQDMSDASFATWQPSDTTGFTQRQFAITRTGEMTEGHLME